ncbi:glycosyltransferase family 2 protein [Thioclava sp. A2]|uniref:glycosyltransferase family 2 protein n=1 Tax=Thioclava sp. FCG-A2 TaxID=3080562 RepID=UPI0029531A26|nr:glycosyltransferase family 2 protein [Thioclava sp. A2]MDV7271833.1 glycosyltransferase family 2 protein [Thioclava sp. A2]
MKTYISIVSHGHQHMLMENSLLAASDDFRIFVRENIPERDRVVPDEVSYSLNLRKAGFGSNHNKTFETAQPNPDDWFVICNPDIIATPEQVRQLLTQAEAEGVELAAPMLWNNKTDRFDHNVRPRVRLLYLMLSFVGMPGPSRYSAGQLEKLQTSDWASGAFLAIKAGLFRKLGGFDDRYFMYMEDVDFCRRAELLGARVRYFGNVRMIHNAARDNRRLFSRSFLNHLRSAMRFFFF